MIQSEIAAEIIIELVVILMPLITLLAGYLVIFARVTKRALLLSLLGAIAYSQTYDITLPALLPNLRDPATPIAYLIAICTVGLGIRVLLPGGKSFDRLLTLATILASGTVMYTSHTILVSNLMANELHQLKKAHANFFANQEGFTPAAERYCEHAQLECELIAKPLKPDSFQHLSTPLSSVAPFHVTTLAASRGGARLVPEEQGHIALVIDHYHADNILLVRDFQATQAIFKYYKILLYSWVLIVMAAWFAGALWVAKYHRQKIFGKRARWLDPDHMPRKTMHAPADKSAAV